MPWPKAHMIAYYMPSLAYSLCLCRLASLNLSKEDSKEHETAELQIGEITGDDLASSVNVVDDLFGLPPSSAGGSSSSSGLKETEKTKSNVEQIAELFNLPMASKVTIEDVSVWIEFQTCLASGSFAYVYDADRKNLLGVVKTAKFVLNSFSFQALCKVHRPSNTCKCWVSFSNESQRIPVFRDLLKWLGHSRCEKTSHIDSSSEIRKAYGMKIRK